MIKIKEDCDMKNLIVMFNSQEIELQIYNYWQNAILNMVLFTPLKKISLGFSLAEDNQFWYLFQLIFIGFSQAFNTIYHCTMSLRKDEIKSKMAIIVNEITHYKIISEMKKL